MQKSFGDNYPLKSPKSQDEDHLQSFCKQMLKNRTFTGNYQERRYVESLAGYRDLIVLRSCDEEFKNDLKYIRNRISKYYEGENEKLWVGISLPEMIGAPAAVCLWTEITDLAFGQYSFIIKSVRFRQNEFIIKIKVVPPTEGQSEGDGVETDGNIEFTAESLIDLLTSWKESITKSVLHFLSQDLKIENILSALKFLSILMLSLMAASIQALKFIGIFTLRFMTEFRMLLHTCMPIILKLIDLIGNMVGGILIMVTMVYKDIVNSFRGPEYREFRSPQMYASIADKPTRYTPDKYNHRPQFL